MKTTICSLALILAAPAAAQGITIAEGDNLQWLTVRVLQESDLTAAGAVVLDETEFLDIEITGRTVRQDLDTSRPRRVMQNGVWRVELPGAARLMSYRREGGDHYGFLFVPTDGFARVVLERDGDSWSKSPFADRIGVSPDGSHAVVAMLNGGVQIMHLQDGPQPSTFVQTTAPVIPSSLLVGTHAFFITEDKRLWRLALHGGTPPEDVSPTSESYAAFKNEMALSEDGSTLVFLYGPSRRLRLWVLRESGPASKLPPTRRNYKEPGYLPEGEGIPHLLLNDDGTNLFFADRPYVGGTDIEDEFYLIDLAAPSEFHVTADANFEAYIGAVILPFFRAGTLLAAFGHPDLTDWFTVDGTTTGISNLTLTGPTVKPFGEGSLDPRSAALTPAGLLVTERTAPGELRLRRLDPDTGPGSILYEGLLGNPVPGSHFSGQADFLVRTTAGDRVLSGSTGEELGAEVAVIALSPPARGPDNRVTLFRASHDGLGATVFIWADETSTTTPAQPNLIQSVLTSGGGALLNAATLSYIAPRVFTVVPTNGDLITLVLSGAGS